MKRIAVAVLLLLVSCGSDPTPPAESPTPKPKVPATAALPEEKHLADLRQITLFPMKMPPSNFRKALRQLSPICA
jgi:hypothetical protein